LPAAGPTWDQGLLSTHPAFPIVALLAEMLRHVDVEIKIVSGPFERKTEPYLDQWDYRIPLDRLKPAIDGWMDLALIRPRL